jgi:hypothetical protein
VSSSTSRAPKPFCAKPPVAAEGRFPPFAGQTSQTFFLAAKILAEFPMLPRMQLITTNWLISAARENCIWQNGSK